MQDYERTRLCGCGECRFQPFLRPCPQANAKTAIWLWKSKFPKSEDSLETNEEIETTETTETTEEIK